MARVSGLRRLSSYPLPDPGALARIAIRAQPDHDIAGGGAMAVVRPQRDG
jgi:hypothetical protein